MIKNYQDVMNELCEVLSDLDGEALASIYNKYVDSPRIEYIGDSLYETKEE